jgi:hypothetical protein
MRILICIDDTDNLESKGTGAIASEMRRIVKEKGWGSCSFITRHQLLLHPDVPYTSHNSSMCFSADIADMYFDTLKQELADYLGTESADGSDPGICIADLDNILSMEDLIVFGFRAKREILTKDLAYETAAKAGVFLEEKGGSGDGVIGALAGVGLRLNGNDGEVKGGIANLQQGEYYTVEELLQEELISSVCTQDMIPLKPTEKVRIKWKVKPVLHNGLPVLLAAPAENGGWITLDKKELRQYGDDRTSTEACKQFKADVPEELVGNRASCFNCAYRRWTVNSFLCALEQKRGK